MKMAIVWWHGVVLDDCSFKLQYTNGCFTLILRIGKSSQYIFSINGMFSLELASGKVFVVEICGLEKRRNDCG